MGKLAMDTTTIGYSSSGISALISTIDTTIKNGQKQIHPDTSDAFKTLVATLDQYWDGNDEAAFVADLKAMAITLATALTNYNSQISQALNNYKSQFLKFQNTTYSQGKIKL